MVIENSDPFMLKCLCKLAETRCLYIAKPLTQVLGFPSNVIISVLLL